MGRLELTFKHEGQFNFEPVRTSDLPNLWNDTDLARCPFMPNTHAAGFVIRAHKDFEITVDQYGNASDGEENLIENIGTRTFAWGDYSAVMYQSPWVIESPTWVRYSLVSPWTCSRQVHKDFEPCTGVVKFRAKEPANAVFLLPAKGEEYSVKINAGEPLVQMVPLQYSEVDLQFVEIEGITEYRTKNDVT